MSNAKKNESDSIDMVMPTRPFDPNEDVIKFAECPHCGGRGWFYMRGVYGLKGQCQTCLNAYKEYKANGY